MAKNEECTVTASIGPLAITIGDDPEQTELRVEGTVVELAPHESVFLFNTLNHRNTWRPIGGEEIRATLHAVRDKISARLASQLPPGTHYLVDDRSGCYILSAYPQSVPA